MFIRSAPARSPRRRLAQLSRPLAATLVLGASAQAQLPDTTWIGTTGDWFNSASWNPSVPSFSSNDAFINNGGTARINTSGALANYVLLGWTAATSGTLEIGAGGNAFFLSLGVGGAAGTGELRIIDGGKLTTSGGAVGVDFGGVGNALIDGAGSSWTVSSDFNVAVNGTGTTTLSNGGALTVGSGNGRVILSQDRNSIGTLKIGNGAGAGKLNALEVTGYQDLELGEGGTSTIIFNHSDANYMFAPGIYDRISLQQIGPGRTILTGAAGTYDYYGETLITDGALIPLHGLTNSFGAIPSTVTVGLNGTLGGMGTIDGLTTVSGTLSPGLDGGGLLTFSSDLTLDSTATVKFELGGVIRGTSYDGVNVPAILNYGGTLELSLINGFQVHVGDTFRLFSAFTAFTGSFSDMVFDQPGFAGTYNHNNGLFTVTAVPEPTQAALLAASLLPFFATRRLRRI